MSAYANQYTKSNESFLDHVCRLAQKRGLVVRFEIVGKKIYAFAKHPMSLEHSMTIELAGDQWAINENGNPITPCDTVAALASFVRRRTTIAESKRERNW